MAKRGMRRKNRQLKLTVDIPDEYADEEEFMEAMMERMDDTGWEIKLDIDEDEDTEVRVPVGKINLGDIDIEPEEEEGE